MGCLILTLIFTIIVKLISKIDIQIFLKMDHMFQIVYQEI